MFLSVKAANANSRFIFSIVRGFSSLSGHHASGCRIRGTKALKTSDGLYISRETNVYFLCPTHGVLHRAFCSSDTKPKKEPVYRRPKWIYNISYWFLFQQSFYMISHKRILKKAKMNSESFVKGIMMAFLSVNNKLAENSYDDLENMVMPELYRKIQSGENIKSAKIPALFHLEEHDVVSMSLTSLNISKDKETNLQ